MIGDCMHRCTQIQAQCNGFSVWHVHDRISWKHRQDNGKAHISLFPFPYCTYSDHSFGFFLLLLLFLCFYFVVCVCVFLRVHSFHRRNSTKNMNKAEECNDKQLQETNTEWSTLKYLTLVFSVNRSVFRSHPFHFRCFTTILSSFSVAVHSPILPFLFFPFHLECIKYVLSDNKQWNCIGL